MSFYRAIFFVNFLMVKYSYNIRSHFNNQTRPRKCTHKKKINNMCTRSAISQSSCRRLPVFQFDYRFTGIDEQL